MHNLEARSDLPGSPALPSVSRRTLLGAAGAAGILAATAGVRPASAVTTPTTVGNSGHCFFGSNQDVFLRIRSKVPGLRGVRIYGAKPVNGVNKLASRWPAGPSPADQGPIVYSIYPLPDTVLNPKNPHHSATIAAIEKTIHTAPPNSYLNSWHEALTLKGSTPPGATPAIMKSLHSALNVMCKKSAHVTYGSIFGASANFLVHQGMKAPAGCVPASGAPRMWDSVPDDLGFYGIDPYGHNDIDKFMCFFDTFITNAKLKAASGYPKIILAETNNKATVANRVEWFDQVATRMHTYGSHAVGILTFWREGGNLSGGWHPTKPLVTGMNKVINNILV
jgi:hypothetical protein